MAAGAGITRTGMIKVSRQPRCRHVAHTTLLCCGDVIVIFARRYAVVMTTGTATADNTVINIQRLPVTGCMTTAALGGGDEMTLRFAGCCAAVMAG